jgi:hypothetical protein
MPCPSLPFTLSQTEHQIEFIKGSFSGFFRRKSEKHLFKVAVAGGGINSDGY